LPPASFTQPEDVPVIRGGKREVTTPHEDTEHGGIIDDEQISSSDIRLHHDGVHVAAARESTKKSRGMGYLIWGFGAMSAGVVVVWKVVSVALVKCSEEGDYSYEQVPTQAQTQASGVLPVAGLDVGSDHSDGMQPMEIAA